MKSLLDIKNTAHKAEESKEKLLVHFEELYFRKYISDVESKINQLKKVIKNYLNLSIGDFTQEVYNRAIKEPKPNKSRTIFWRIWSG